MSMHIQKLCFIIILFATHFSLFSEKWFTNKKHLQTSFHIAAGQNNISCMERWLSDMENDDNKNAMLNHKDIWGNTPLRYAVRSKKLQSLEFLLFHYADYRCVDGSSNNLLHCAALSGSLSCAKYLLTWESYFKKDKELSLLSMKNNGGRTPLHLAAFNGNIKMIDLFLSWGANIDASDKWGCPPLRYAINHHFNAAFVHLISKGADIHMKDINNGTLLHGAVIARNVYAVHVLLSMGIALDTKNKSGQTAYDVALRKRRHIHVKKEHDACQRYDKIMTMITRAHKSRPAQQVFAPLPHYIWPQ